eukprot:PITA_09448
MNSVHLVLSLAASFRWEVCQMDVKSAFLHGDLHEEIYMEQPIGSSKQTPALCYSDNTVYTKKVGKSLIILVLYVDDLILTGSDPNLINHVKSSLKKKFEMTDLGHLHYFLGLQVLQSKEGISLSQSKYACDILRHFHMEDFQFGIHYSAKASPLLVGFTDSDWTGDPDDQKSTVGYVFTLGSGPITWACKKQGVISLSSAEAEYRGAVEASKEALWLCQILLEFGFQQQHPTTLWCDKQSAIQLCKDPVQHQRSKHIELHMHFIRKLIHDHVLEVQYCSTDDQVADIFTKALTEAKFTKLRFMVGVQEVVTKGG